MRFAHEGRKQRCGGWHRWSGLPSVCMIVLLAVPSPAIAQFVGSAQWEMLGRSRIDSQAHYAAGVVDALRALDLVRQSGPQALFSYLPYSTRRLRVMSVDDVRALTSKELEEVDAPGYAAVRGLAAGLVIDLPARAHAPAVITKFRWNFDGGLAPVLQWGYVAGVADAIWTMNDRYQDAGPEATSSVLQAAVRCAEPLTLFTIYDFTERVKKTTSLADAPAAGIVSYLGDCRTPAVPAVAGPPPATADVRWTTQPTGGQVTVALRIVVPAGDAQQPVRVVAIGSDGSAKVVYQGMHAPGETVTVSASGTPPIILQVYVASTMVKQIAVPARQ